MKTSITALINADVITMEPELPSADAVLIEGERIAAVGSTEEISKRVREGGRLIDLAGRTVVPGFIDTHTHFTMTGVNMLAIDCREMPCIADVLDLIVSRRDCALANGLLLVVGLRRDDLTDLRYPTIQELDRTVPQQPLCILERGGHAVMANTPFLAMLPIPEETEGIMRDPSSGQPTGLLRAQANSLARKYLHSELIPPAHKRAGLQAASERALMKGTTTVHCLEGGDIWASDTDMEALLDCQTELPVRTVLYWQTIDAEKVLKRGLTRIGGCIWLDGSGSMRTAAFFDEYLDEPGNCGVLYFSQEEVNEFVLAAHTAGLQVAVHAIGDRGIEQALSAYRHANQRVPRADHRHRIEHFQFPTDRQMDEAAELGVALAMQPAIERMMGGVDGPMVTYLGPERAARCTPTGEMVRRGVLVAGGSDSDVTPIDPLLGMGAALTQSNPSLRVNQHEALELFTIGAARISFEEDQKGSIAPGKLADLAVLDRNPLQCPADEVERIRVLETIVGGQTAFAAGDQP